MKAVSLAMPFNSAEAAAITRAALSRMSRDIVVETRIVSTGIWPFRRTTHIVSAAATSSRGQRAVIIYAQEAARLGVDSTFETA